MGVSGGRVGPYFSQFSNCMVQCVFHGPVSELSMCHLPVPSQESDPSTETKYWFPSEQKKQLFAHRMAQRESELHFSPESHKFLQNHVSPARTRFPELHFLSLQGSVAAEGAANNVQRSSVYIIVKP